MITAFNDDIVCEIKADLMKIFKMKDLGELWSWFNLQDSKMHIKHIDPNIHLSKDQCSSTDEEKVSMSKIPYRQAIGSLMWATVVT